MNGVQTVQGAQSIYRTAEILELLLASPTGMTARDVAAAARLPLSTTHRILTVLCEKRLLRQEVHTRNYVAGQVWMADVLWARQLKMYNNFAEIPFLLVKEFGHTAYLHCRLGYAYQCLVRAEGEGAVQIFSSYQGEIRHLGDGAGSFGMLAFIEKVERDLIVKTNLPLFRERLLRSVEELHEVLELAASRGYVSTGGFRVAGTSAVAVPIRYKNEVVGAISVSGVHDKRWEAQHDSLLERLRERIDARLA